MMTKPLSNPLIQYKALDMLIWVSVLLLWREYYRLTDPPQMTWIFASITTFFAAFTFYYTYYYGVPLYLSGHWWKFSFIMLCTLLLLVGLRSTLIYFSFRIVLPEYEKGWSLFRSITASSFHVIYAATLATLIRFVIERYEAQKKLDAIRQENLRTELIYLKAQLNPHFLFNIHNSIYFLIEDDPKRAAEVLLKLSSIMKYQLYDCNQEEVLLSAEIEHLKSYVELEKMRIEEVVEVEFTAQVSNQGQQIAPFILLALVENVFKHVSQSTGQKNSIQISISAQEQCLCLETKNSIDAQWQENSNGLGLKNVRRRLELLYPNRHTLNIDKTTDGYYLATLKLKLQA